MGPTEDRDQPQIYFCMKCGGPGTCVLKSTGQRFCVRCALTLKDNSPAKIKHLSPSRRKRVTNLKGQCAICYQWDNLTKHHSKPWIEGAKREGPIWRLCYPCHSDLHRVFRNKTLRTLSLEEARRAITFHPPQIGT